jgi:hypothetical protein
MKEDFWRAFDVLVLSVYPDKHTAESLQWIEDACKANGVQLDLKDEAFQVSNFKTMLEPTPTGPEETARKFAGCFFRHFSRNASYGYFFTCCCGPHIPMLVQNRPFGSDGVLIRELDEERLHGYLNRTDPLGACFVCAGRDTAMPLTWHEERDPEKWLKESAGVMA